MDHERKYSKKFSNGNRTRIDGNQRQMKKEPLNDRGSKSNEPKSRVALLRLSTLGGIIGRYQSNAKVKRDPTVDVDFPRKRQWPDEKRKEKKRPKERGEEKEQKKRTKREVVKAESSWPAAADWTRPNEWISAPHGGGAARGGRGPGLGVHRTLLEQTRQMGSDKKPAQRKREREREREREKSHEINQPEIQSRRVRPVGDR